MSRLTASGRIEEALALHEEHLERVGVDQARVDWDRKDVLIRTHFCQEAIHDIDEGTLRDLVHSLWAFTGWTNKDYLVNEMTKDGLQPVRDALHVLMFGSAPLEDRFDHARTNIRMMGPAAISEILCHTNNREYPVWTRRTSEGLIWLGVDGNILPKSMSISGKRYLEICRVLQIVLEEVRSQCPKINTLSELNALLFFLSGKPRVDTPDPLDGDDFEHNEVVSQIVELGDGLGFDARSEVSITHGCRIDALWQSRVANLGSISYAFEVHRRGSRDAAILNLQRVLRQDPSIQRVILVTSPSEIAVFEREIASLGEDLRRSIGYFPVHELRAALVHLQDLKGILGGLGLLAMARHTGGTHRS